jgi:D-aspartate ligase
MKPALGEIERAAADPDLAGDRTAFLAQPMTPTLVPADVSDPRGALIIGGVHGSLAVARSLGRRGIPVWFLGNERNLPRFSRYVSRNLWWRGPDQGDAAAELLDIASLNHLHGWVLFPGGDEEARLISRHHSALSSVFQLTTPPWEQMKWAYDKRLTYERAAHLGIRYPLSHYPRDRDEVAALVCRFPVILKPTVHERKNAFTRKKAWRIDNRTELTSRYDEAFALMGADAIILQELVPGSGSAQFSYAGVWDRGMPVASLVARRQRQFPIDFGFTSTFVQTTENPEVEAAAILFLKSIEFNGLVEVEFKYDRRDQQYKILDVNARSWSWCALGAVAGEDFPYILWRLAIGEHVAPTRGQAGAAWMLSIRDIVAAVSEMVAGNLSPIDYLRSLHGPMAFGAFAADDPLPGVLELPVVAARVLKRHLFEMTGRSGIQ